jgi:hypothetical protein
MAWSPRYSEQQVRDAVGAAPSMAQALRRLGLRPAGGNLATLKKLIAAYGISTEHFDPNWMIRTGVVRRAMPLERVLVQDSTYDRGKLKQRLYESGLKHRRCELCGQGEEWRGARMGLILDHINGVPDDNRLENLRIVCPNCAATLETHCARKNRIKRDPRICLCCGQEFGPKYDTQRYCSRKCGTRHGTGGYKPRPQTRKIARPSFEQLTADLGSMSFLAVGRKYGVSDNAIRKWLRWYERQAERERAVADGEETPDDEAA